jgi:hypothetical protein
MATTSSAPAKHRWRFFRAGGVDQVRLETAADILNLDQLDQKLWVALSCPTRGLDLDERTLQLLDSDQDGRVRVPEILEAVRWLGQVLKDPEELIRGKDGLTLAAIDTGNAEGKRLHDSARHVLQSLGKRDQNGITVAEITATSQFFAEARRNGDGVVPPSAIDDGQASKVAQEIIDCLGGRPDRSGKPGIDGKLVANFFDACRAYADWHAQVKPGDQKLLAAGDGTGAAVQALQAVRKKIDDWFGRCRLAAFDPRSAPALRGEEKLFAELATRELSFSVKEVAGLPLAAVEPGKPLPLDTGLNPAWADAMAEFKERVVALLLGQDKASLGEGEWGQIKAKLAAYEAWQAGRQGVAVEKLGIARIQEILTGKSRHLLEQAVAEDLAIAAEIDAIVSVEKLVRYCRDLHRLLNNYVSFADFYSRRRPAVFQAGRLYIDQRCCDLCVRVDDPGKHGTLAVMAKSYLAYCDLVRAGSNEKMQIAAAFTAGDSDNLFVGRNGVFYDRQGRDWDATISKIVDQPISIGQAFWSPYKKLLRWIEDQVAKRAAAADTDSAARLQSAATATAAGGPPPAKPKLDIGVVAAIGVAVGGITAALGALLNAFFGLGFLMPLGVVGLLLLISGPAMLIAWMKLRQRNLGPILDANGWAVNGRVRINIPLGASLTEVAKVPAGAERSLVDPFAEKRPLWPKLVLALLLLGGVWFGLHRAGILQRIDWYANTWNKLFPPAEQAQQKG